MAVEVNRPMVISTIMDNSVVVEKQEVRPNNGTLFSVITSDRGRDGELLNFNSVDTILNEFCVNKKPNPKVHGQAILDVLNHVENGGNALILKVAPENATYPNGFLAVQTEVKPYGAYIDSIEYPDKIIIS